MRKIINLKIILTFSSRQAAERNQKLNKEQKILQILLQKSNNNDINLLLNYILLSY